MADYESRGASLTAPAIVEAAKDQKAWPSLYKHLWEVPETDLAMEARLARAHRLMISVTITTEEGVRTRLFLHTNQYDGYRPLDAVLSNKNLAGVKFAELTADISRARARLRSFRAMLPTDLAADIDADLERAENKAKQQTAPEQAAS